MLGIGLVLVIPCFALGSLLPTWMFINTLQLAAHLPLLNTNMPANVHYVLSKQLQLVSWHDKDFLNLIGRIIPSNLMPISQYDIKADALNPLLDICGFKHPFIESMLLIMSFAFLIVISWLILSIKDAIGCCSSRSENSFCKRRHGRQCNNFLIRFIYEFFLTFCLVIFINLSIIKLEEPTLTFSYIVTAGCSIVLTGLFLFLLSRLCCNGPYIKGYHMKGTAMSSRWGMRPVNPGFDANAYLKAQQDSKKQQSKQ